MKDILTEIDSIKQRSQKSINELHGLNDFFKMFTKIFQDEVDILSKDTYYKNMWKGQT